MVTGSINLQPRTGRDRLDHARRIAEILENAAYGLTINEIVIELFGGTSPTTQSRLEYEIEEFKRSYQYCNDRFNTREPGWIWIRTRRRHPNDWVYIAVAKMCNDNVVRMIDASISYESYDRYRKDWETRTKTLTRMQVVDIEARKESALMNGNVTAANRIDAEFDHLRIISPRLGQMYFGAGLVDENLEILENDRRGRIFNRQIRQVRDDIKRLQRSTANLTHNVTEILRLRGVV